MKFFIRKAENPNIYSYSEETGFSKFKIGQTVKSDLGGFRGVIIKILPNASATHTDMYIIKTGDGKRKSIEESFLELDETVITTEINGIKQEVVIEDALHDSDFKPQFPVGSYVQHEIDGSIMMITKFLGNRDATGQPLYEAFDENGEKHIISETMLEPCSSKQFKHTKVIDVPFSEVGEQTSINKESEIELKTDKILSFLNISYSKDPMIQLENAMKIHKYIAQNSSYTPDIMQEKTDYNIDEVYVNELYNGLINKRGVCTTDAVVFKYLLSKIGMHGDVVILESKEGGVHVSTLVKLGDESYYFDTTLERTIFEQKSNNPEKFVFCCVALGQREYSQFYSSVGILPENLRGSLLPMPADISEDSVPKLIIQSIGHQIQNLTFKENTLDEDLGRFNVPISMKDQSNLEIAKEIHRKEMRKEK